MNKKLNTLFSFIFLFSVCGCNNDVSSSISSSLNESELKTTLLKLKDNNFTIDYVSSFVNNKGQESYNKFYYTEYSFQGEGDFGFIGVAQGEDLIFRYNLDKNTKEVIPGTPLINSNTGTRYQSIFDYQESYGMNKFDFNSLPTEKDSNGYYTYEFGHNIHNDRLIMPIFLRFTPASLPPNKLKIKVAKDIIIFEAEILSYDLDNDGVEESKDTVTATVYDIGKTENKEIKQYLKDGKTSKTPLDMKFYQFFHPYLFSNNYTVDMDATQMKNDTGMYYSFKMTEYLTDNAILDVQGNKNQGYILTQGCVATFNIANDKVNILGTQTNEDGELITSLYDEFMTMTTMSLSYDVLIGYKDDKKDNVYYLTDSYLIYVLGYQCYNEIYEENYCDKVKIEIINEETHEFNLYFDMYNKNSGRNYGTYKARFYDLNNTFIPEVDKYLSYGADPKTQTKEDLANILDLLKTHNYSMDTITSAGMTKSYNTPNYFYLEVYGNPNNNMGFIKVNESIYKFYIKNEQVIIDYSIDYASGDNPLEMVSVGEFYGNDNDFGFISAISEEIYNIDNYTLSNVHMQDYWKLTDLVTARKILKYYLPYNNIQSTGVGIIFDNSIDNTKLTFLSSFISNDGSIEGYVTYTYYDLGTTSHPIIEEYLESLKGE